MTADEEQWLIKRFEEHRPQLKAVAYRMLGSVPEAEEAVQDAWLRLSRSGAAGGLVVRDGRPFALIGFTVSGGKIAEIDLITDPEHLGQLGLDDLAM